MKLGINFNKGFAYSNNKLVLNFEPSKYVEHTANGILVRDLNGKDGQSGHSTEDNYTIIKSKTGNLQTNPEVVEYIFSMCAYKVKDNTRGSIDTYSVDTSVVKTPQEIIDEINYCIDYDNGNSHAASYILKTNELLQLQDKSYPWKLPKWSKAMDGLNRHPDSKCLVLFFIKKSTYSENNAWYCRHLTLVCLYSSIPEYVKGQEYVINSKNNF